MLFQRRDKELFWNKTRNLLWPRMGWRRVYYYWKHRTIRIPAGEYAIAMGLYLGCAVSWTPTFGTHLLQCLFFCWLFRANFFAAFIGSAFGNFWTTPFLMFASYQVGHFTLDIFGADRLIADNMGAMVLNLFVDLDWEDVKALFAQHGWKLFLPTLLGGYMMAVLSFPFFYYPFYYMIKGAKAARQKVIEHKIHKEAETITGQES